MKLYTIKFIPLFSSLSEIFLTRFKIATLRGKMDDYSPPDLLCINIWVNEAERVLGKRGRGFWVDFA